MVPRAPELNLFLGHKDSFSGDVNPPSTGRQLLPGLNTLPREPSNHRSARSKWAPGWARDAGLHRAAGNPQCRGTRVTEKFHIQNLL